MIGKGSVDAKRQSTGKRPFHSVKTKAKRLASTPIKSQITRSARLLPTAGAGYSHDMAKKTKKSEPKKSASGAQGATNTIISENRKASFRYEVIEHVECGMVLLGSEVKAMRSGKVSLEEAYGRVKSGELWLINSDIAEYREATRWNHSPKRPRKLLVHKRQYQQLSRRAQERGLTLIPLKLYFNPRGIAKLLLGICKGKRIHDKRETLKEADAKRRIDRSMKRTRT